MKHFENILKTFCFFFYNCHSVCLDLYSPEPAIPTILNQ